MEVSDQLLEKFFTGNCTESEQESVRLYLAQHPELLEKYADLANWDAFAPRNSLPAAISEKMYGVIERRIRPAGKKRMLVLASAVAAAVLIGLGGWWLMDNPAKKDAVKPVMAASLPEKQPAPYVSKMNITAARMVFSLPDKSKVELSPGSQIRYSPDFPFSDRKIILKGTATFSVSPDKTKPFTVYARGVGTTALGTVFTISEKSNGSLQIALLKGRVVVRADSLRKSNSFKEVYLRPGQQVLVDRFSSTAIVQRSEPSIASDPLSNVSSLQGKTILRYTNQPLDVLLKGLGRRYSLKFIYKSATLENLTFTGIFDEAKETVDQFLSTLCLLNALEMKKEKNNIIISTRTFHDPGLSN